MTRLRMADQKDAPAMARLQNACFAQKWDAEFFANCLLGPHIAVLAEVEGEIGAYILVQCAGPDAEIISIGTSPKKRRSGLARAILIRAGDEALLLHAQSLFLEVAENNAPALGLYTSAGFRDAGRRKAYYIEDSSPVDARVLRAALPLKP